MKKLIVAGACALAVGLVAPMPVAQAQSQVQSQVQSQAKAKAAAAKCASKLEYRKVRAGMTKVEVAQIFGFKGVLQFSYPPYSTREYAACTGNGGYVTVTFKNRKATEKEAFWTP